MDRRALLASLTAALAGCPASPEGVELDGSSPTPTRTPASTPTPAGPPVGPQRVTVRNTTSRPEFVTVVVEADGRTFFVESLDLPSGTQLTFGDVVARGGTYAVLVETDGGTRTRYRWRVEEGLDGLVVTLADGISFWRTARCRPGCALATGGERPDLPLVGDGSLRWYGAAGVVLRNPRDGAVAVDLGVDLDGETILRHGYRVPPGSQVVVPVTFRSGEYRVRVGVDGRTLEREWPVPEMPQRYVTLADPVDFGCGPANTVIRADNRDGERHRLRMVVRRDGGVRFDETFELAPGGTREVEPVSESGRYEVRFETDAGASLEGTWWTCPPRGPGSVLISATGEVLFDYGPR